MRDSTRLQILCDWAADKGYHVDLHPADHEADEVDPATKVITIATGQTPRQKVYALAHELGHILGFESADFLFIDRGRSGRSRRGRLAILENEIDAWRRGWRLSERLGLGLSSAGFEAEASKWLVGYASDVVRA